MCVNFFNTIEGTYSLQVLQRLLHHKMVLLSVAEVIYDVMSGKHSSRNTIAQTCDAFKHMTSTHAEPKLILHVLLIYLHLSGVNSSFSLLTEVFVYRECCQLTLSIAIVDLQQQQLQPGVLRQLSKAAFQLSSVQQGTGQPELTSLHFEHLGFSGVLKSAAHAAQRYNPSGSVPDF